MGSFPPRVIDAPKPKLSPLESMVPDARGVAVLSVLSHLIWPFQAALVAVALGGLLTGVTLSAALAGLGFVALGAVRAVLGVMADARADDAAQTVIQTLRNRIVTTETRRASDSSFGGAGSISSLAGEKLDLIAPYITRYAPAQARVMVIPLVIFVLALWHAWAVAVVLLITGPLIPVFMVLVGLAAKDASHRQMTEMGTLNDLLVERLSALVDIRVLGARDVVMAGFAAQTDDVRRRTMAVLRVAFLSSTVLELFAAIGVAMVAVYVGFSLLGALEFGTWGAALTPQAGIFLLLLAPEFYQPLRDLSAAWHDKAAAEAVAEDLAQWNAAQSPRLIGHGAPAAALSGPPRVLMRGCVSSGGLALPDIDISAGESVALMGPSGVGKTTALLMMAGLLAPVPGTIRVAGQTLNEQTADAWRARIGWMPQAPHFLNASLRRNLTLGRGGDLALAMHHAAIADVVARLPQGLDTRLGETGGGLSGGEARRLTLARAIYGLPDLILADEPTADLDAATAQLVTDGLIAQVRRGATLIVATHDHGLAARMDRIIRLGADI